MEGIFLALVQWGDASRNGVSGVMSAFPGSVGDGSGRGSGVRALSVSSCASGMVSTYDLNTSKYSAAAGSAPTTCSAFLFNAWLLANFVQAL